MPPGTTIRALDDHLATETRETQSLEYLNSQVDHMHMSIPQTIMHTHIQHVLHTNTHAHTYMHTPVSSPVQQQGSDRCLSGTLYNSNTLRHYTLHHGVTHTHNTQETACMPCISGFDNTVSTGCYAHLLYKHISSVKRILLYWFFALFVRRPPISGVQLL